MSRRAAERFGRRAEWIAVARLRLAGFRTIARRYRHPLGEVDLVVRRGRLVAFVEVKARADLVAAEGALTDRQWRRVAAAATAFCAQRPDLADCDRRFDAVLVAPWRWPRHRADAWRPR